MAKKKTSSGKSTTKAKATRKVTPKLNATSKTQQEPKRRAMGQEPVYKVPPEPKPADFEVF